MELCHDPATADLRVCPAMEPPPGYKPMDPDAYTLEPYMTATTVVCLSLVVIAVTVRSFTKGFLIKSFSAEDYAFIVATAFFAAFLALMNYGTQNFNSGKHQWNVSIADVIELLKNVNLVQMMYPPCMFFSKLGLLLQIARIFSDKQRNYIFWASWTLIVANGILYLGVFLSFLLACWPREKIWNDRAPGRCIDTNASMISTSALNVVSDFAILILPIWSVLQLRMPVRRKIGVSAVFATGVFSCIAGVLRMWYTSILFKTPDFSYWISPAGMMCVAELTTVILCGCSPTFPRFARFCAEKIGAREADTKYSLKRTESPSVPRLISSRDSYSIAA
ncbi:unnamed protein product [Periconia digitata]|uniref:Rhodopsin domain-containing protein n=1 Tax=Periconia digitata TaxID=1303443 RepID=A0A9W4UQC3_9PLEO|nr:unnamed protein product [Periconia digitata]